MEEKISLKTKLWRGLIFAFCLLVCLQCYYVLDLHYTPLARYPFGTPEQRVLIEENLSADDIDYLITSQMEPEVFMPFMEIDGFNIRNAYFYQAALQTRSAQPEIIVDFVNHYRKQWTLSEMESLLRFYSYNDLSDYSDSAQSAELISQPDDMLLTLDADHTVWTYTPSNLRMEGDLILNEEALNAWEALCTAALEDGIVLQPLAGYISFRQQKENGQNSPYPTSKSRPYGTREEQLGYSLVLEPAIRAVHPISACDEGDNGSYDELQLEEEDLLQAEWLKAHAADYGFIIRYPENKSEATSHTYQPFILRYAGIPAAVEMRDLDLCLEGYNEYLQAAQ